MERDSVLLAISLDALKSVLSRILKKVESPNMNPNLLAFLLRFLFTIRSLNPLLEQIVKMLSSIQCKKHKQLGNLDLYGAWINAEAMCDREKEKDRIYFGVIYPTARAIDAQGSSRLFNRASIDMGLSFLGKLIENEKINGVIDSSLKILPIFWALFNAHSYASSSISGKTKAWLHRMLNIVSKSENKSELVLLDLKLGMNHMINPGVIPPNDIQLLQEAAQKPSLVHKIKAWKWLSFFGFQLSEEFIHDILSRLDSYVYSIVHMNLSKDFCYYLSIAEDLLFILLNDRRQKQLANFIINALSSDKSWLSSNVQDQESLVALVLGSSLLFASWYLL